MAVWLGCVRDMLPSGGELFQENIMSTIFDFEADCLSNFPHLSCFLCMFLRSERKRVCSNKISRLGGMTKQEFGFWSGFTFDGHLCGYKGEHMQYTGPDNFKVTLNIYDCMTRDYSTMRTVSTMCHLMRHIILIAAIFSDYAVLLRRFRYNRSIACDHTRCCRLNANH